MALIETKKGKKVITINESEVLHQSHLQHVITALEAFSESKVIETVKSTPYSSYTYKYHFTFSSSITTKVLRNALIKLKLKV